MCGFAGVVRHGGGADRALAERMGASLAHRGPDQGATHLHERGPLSVALASRRLAILDLSSAGDQPMHSTDALCCIAYNGELYNEPTLRSGLEARGFSFWSRTDTETVLHAYEDRGVDSFSSLNGMFALAIVDQRKGQVVLARDRMGIKPLYYTWDGARLVFASELRTLVRVAGVPFGIDPAGLDLFLALGFVPAPFSLVRRIRKLAPGSCLILDATGRLTITDFWQPRLVPDPDRRLEGAKETVRDTLRDAVRRQMRSDVPVGVLLSGGVDSTIVASAAAAATDHPLTTFTVAFSSPRVTIDEELNADAGHARRLSRQLGSTHHEVVVNDDRYLPALLKQLAVGLDEPVWEASFVSIYAISRLAHEHGIKVLLTGDGSDELFLGYPWHAAAWRQQSYERLPFLRQAAAVATRILPARSGLWGHATNLLAVVGASDAERYQWSHRVFSRHERARLIGANGPTRGGVLTELVTERVGAAAERPLGERMALLDLLLWVREHFNQRLDRMTMLNSVEARVPFQDNEVVDLALALPYAVRAPRGRPKHLLKAAFSSEIPEFVLNRPKRPFAAPMGAWLAGALRPLVDEVLSPQHLREAGLVDSDAAGAMLAAGHAGRNRSLEQAWSLLMLHLWADGLGMADG